MTDEFMLRIPYFNVITGSLILLLSLVLNLFNNVVPYLKFQEK